MRRFIAPVLLLALFVGISSCGEKFQYEKEIKIKDGVWTYADKLHFDLPIQDTSKLYNLYLRVKYTDDFPSQNVYYRIHTAYPSGKKYDQVLSCDLYDVTGKPYGKKGTVISVLREGLYFNETGNFTFDIEQYMRADSAKGIKAVALLMKDSGKKRG